MLKIPFYVPLNDDEIGREKAIANTSIVGIIVNLLLAGMKGAVGVISNSVAITMDAVNSLTDAVSSAVTLVGTKLSTHPPTKNHPFGFGRIEYMTALIVSIVILYAGVSAMLESVEHIIEPSDTDYPIIVLIVLALAVVIKLSLGGYMIAMGKKTGSTALSGSGKDSMYDAFLTLSVLISAIIFIFFGVSIDAYVGVVISLFILKTGVEIMIGSFGDMFGRRSDSDVTKRIKDIVRSEPGVSGAYDLIINNYGPGRDYASIHVEVDSSMTAEEIDDLSRKLQIRVMEETKVALTAIGIYSVDNNDAETVAMKEKVKGIVMAHDWALEMHGFHLDRERMIIRFDVVLSFGVDRGEALETLVNEVSKEIPDYKPAIILDVDLSD